MQTRFWNYRDDDLTASIVQWLTGIIPPGRYFGFDFLPTANLTLTLNHNTTGFSFVDSVPADQQNISLCVTRQGVVVTEDAQITLPINAGDPTDPRIDLVILTHEYITTTGGQTALYSVIEGTPDPSPSAPALTDPLRQIIIGELLIPANTAQLDDVGVEWTQALKPRFAGNSPIDINLTPNRATETDGTGDLIASAVTAAELNVLDGLTASTSELNILAGATVTTSELNILDGITATTTELNYLVGVTSSIQTQLNGKADIAGAETITGAWVYDTPPDLSNGEERNGTVYAILDGTIPAWNMDTTPTASAGHSLSASELLTVKFLSVTVRNDAGTQVVELRGVGGEVRMDGGTITFERFTGERFDTAAFSGLGFDRGRWSLEYIPD